MPQYPLSDFETQPKGRPKDGQLHVYRLGGGQWKGVQYDALSGLWLDVSTLDAGLSRPEALKQTQEVIYARTRARLKDVTER